MDILALMNTYFNPIYIPAIIVSVCVMINIYIDDKWPHNLGTICCIRIILKLSIFVDGLLSLYTGRPSPVLQVMVIAALALYLFRTKYPRVCAIRNTLDFIIWIEYFMQISPVFVPMLFNLFNLEGDAIPLSLRIFTPILVYAVYLDPLTAQIPCIIVIIFMIVLTGCIVMIFPLKSFADVRGYDKKLLVLCLTLCSCLKHQQAVYFKELLTGTCICLAGNIMPVGKTFILYIMTIMFHPIHVLLLFPISYSFIDRVFVRFSGEQLHKPIMAFVYFMVGVVLPQVFSQHASFLYIMCIFLIYNDETRHTAADKIANNSTPYPIYNLRPQEAVNKSMDNFLGNLARYMLIVGRANKGLNNFSAFIMQIMHGGQILLVGSYCEMMPSFVCGDRDMMMVDMAYSEKVGMKHLNYQCDSENPAYCTVWENSKRGGRIFVSSSQFLKDRNDGKQTHGPAILSQSFGPSPSFDFVPCLLYHFLPPCVSKFLTRPRPHGWPSQSFIDKIQQAGCHLVPVGHPDSVNKDIEWRWSFSVAEKELVLNLPDKMTLCMLILKSVKKTHWRGFEDSTQKAFCSYYIKTACLWVCEERAVEDFTVMDLCREVIDWITRAYQRKTMPHYFIPGQNLINHIPIMQHWFVCRKLSIMKDLLAWMVMSSFAMYFDRRVEDVFNNDICASLHLPDISPEFTYKDLFVYLSATDDKDKAMTVLEKAAHKLSKVSCGNHWDCEYDWITKTYDNLRV